MTPDEWSHIKSLFDQALDLESGESRERFLSSIEPESTRAEIKRLLSLHDAESAIFDRLQPDTKLVRSAAELRSLNNGDLIAGRFRIVRFIAEGGMGEVYEAHDEQLNERVAVKTLRWETSQDTAALARFRQEIQLARRVTNPSVCRIHDLWEHKTAGGRSIWFLTMEFLEGETLAHRIERGAMPVAEVLPLLQQMAAGLSAAHDAGIVHRDFKSSNVILVPRQGGGPDRAVVTDFGLSRSFDVRTTASGAVMGTPAYMAPEQIEGGELGPATDVYALGVVLYEMLTGMLPFRSSSPMALAVKKLRETPVPPSSVAAEIPAVWDQVVARCMQYRMADRFHSAGAVLDAIETGKLPALRGRSDLEFRVPARWWQVAVVLLVLAAGAGYWFWARDRGFEPKSEALEWYKQGVKKLNDEAPAAAQGQFERAITVDPGFVAARARLAQSLAEQDLVDSARDELLKLDASSVESLHPSQRMLVSGVRSMAMRDYATAVKHFNGYAQGTTPEDRPEAFLDLARAQFLANDTPGAIISCDKALSERRDYEGGLLLKGRCLARQDKKRDAIGILKLAEDQSALRRNMDGRLAAKIARVETLIMDQDLTESERLAREALAQAESFDSSDSEMRIRLLLSNILRLRRNFEESRREAQIALDAAKGSRRIPLELRAMNDLALNESAQLKYRDAESMFRQAIAIAADRRLPFQEAYSQMYLAEVLFRQSRGEEGLQALDAASRYMRSTSLGQEFNNLRRLQINAAIATSQNDAAKKMALDWIADARRRSAIADVESATRILGHLAVVEGALFQSIEYSKTVQKSASSRSLNVMNDQFNELRQHVDSGDREGARAQIAELKKSPKALEHVKLLNSESRLAALEGRFDEAIALMDRAFRAAGDDVSRADVALHGARLLSLTGKSARAFKLADFATSVYAKSSEVNVKTSCQCTRAELLIGVGRAKEAAQLAWEAIQTGDGKAHRLTTWHCSLVLAAAQKDPAAQAAFLQQTRQLTRTWPPEMKGGFEARSDFGKLFQLAKNNNN